MTTLSATDTELLKTLIANLENLDKAGVIADRDTAQVTKDLACLEARKVLQMVRDRKSAA